MGPRPSGMYSAFHQKVHFCHRKWQILTIKNRVLEPVFTIISSGHFRRTRYWRPWKSNGFIIASLRLKFFCLLKNIKTGQSGVKTRKFLRFQTWVCLGNQIPEKIRDLTPEHVGLWNPGLRIQENAQIGPKPE